MKSKKLKKMGALISVRDCGGGFKFVAVSSLCELLTYASTSPS